MPKRSTIRIAQQTLRQAIELAKAENELVSVIIEKAVEAYRRDRFLDQANQAYAVRRSIEAQRTAKKEGRNSR